MSIMSDIPPNPSETTLIESSHHFRINRLDLHICEESAAASAVQGKTFLESSALATRKSSHKVSLDKCIFIA